MNLPNKLTMARIILVPFMIVFLLVDCIPYRYVWCLIIFVAASLTDMMDGKIARARGLVTNFGKFLDPIADKILVISIMVCFVPDLCHPVILIVVLFREFIVSSLRLIAASQNVVLAAGMSGKIKTTAQMVSISVILFLLALEAAIDGLSYDAVKITSNILLGITAAIAMYSCFEYLYQNRTLIKEE